VARRLEIGGHGIDRSSRIDFTFDGRLMEGFGGDTLASALMANGFDVVCSSPILGRPRGVFSAGVEEPCAFVGISAPRLRPIVPATTVELVDGLEAAGRPGVGILAEGAHGSPPAEHRHLHVETLVVGGGVAGLREASVATRRGDRVLLVDERTWLGGTATNDHTVDGMPALAWIEDVVEELELAGTTTLLTRATATGIYDDGFVIVHEHGPQTERLWHVRADAVVLATGAHERPIVFADDDRPGVMLASAAQLYLDRFGVLPGERTVVFTTNHTGHEVASVLEAAGADLAAIIDVSDGGPATDGARSRGIDVRTGWAVTGVEGERRVSAVHAAGPGGAVETFAADLLLVAGGWNPTTQLWRGIGGGLRYDEPKACFLPDEDAGGPPWLSIVGAAAGDVPESAPFWYTPSTDLSRHFVDLQRDSTVADILDAVEHELRSTEHVKRATYIGTAIDQGRTSGVLTAAIVNQAWGAGPGAQGPTNARPPYTPVPFSVLAGIDRGARLLDPVRTTPIHEWHVEHGAVFENVGQWKRPWYFPGSTSETMEQSVARECRTVRSTVGVLDASTLGKIDVVGPDAAGFLDRMYTNRMSTLAVGSIRYGLMLGLDGMVFDDGVVMRLADDRFFVTTTTGGAANVLDRFEEWLQTEWPNLEVYCTSVTEQWATIAINGPRARRVLRSLGTDADLHPSAFGFMNWRDASVAGLPARLARVSFSGELAFEVNVAAHHGLAMWKAVIEAGEPFGLTPYGTEAMHVLRAEKGFVIVGQDTDGTVTPDDLGMSWIVRKDDSDFVGRRSLTRPDTARADRKHLVGLAPLDPTALLPEGAQVIAGSDAGAPTPVPMLGHVTSSYRSEALDRTFALAMIEGGRDRLGQVVLAPLPQGSVEATVLDPVFYDPGNDRREGDEDEIDEQVDDDQVGDAVATGATIDPRHDARHRLAARADDLVRASLSGDVVIETVAFLAQVDLRLDHSLVGLAPFPLPLEPNTTWERDERAALWLGPDEWMILGPPHGGSDIVRELEGLLGDRHHSVVDVSANRVAIELGGPGRFDLMAKGCSLDLHPRSWGPGRSAQTILAKAQVILHERADSTGIFVRSSFADYLVDWLLAAREGG
jgi:sarcosine oxidase subunit alpha